VPLLLAIANLSGFREVAFSEVSASVASENERRQASEVPESVSENAIEGAQARKREGTDRAAGERTRPCSTAYVAVD
jgi:hypothetical protein